MLSEWETNPVPVEFVGLSCCHAGFIGGLIFADGMPATGILLVCFVLQLGIFIQKYRRMEKLKKSRSNLL